MDHFVRVGTHVLSNNVTVVVVVVVVVTTVVAVRDIERVGM